MAWTTPRTWAVGETLTAANLNTYLRDNTSFLGSGPIVSVSAGAATTMTTAGTWYPVAFNTETVDTDNMHSTVSNTSRLTATTAGYYLVTGQALIATTATATYFHTGILFNGGTNPTNFSSVYIPTTPSTYWGAPVSRIIYMAATQYVELVVRCGVNATPTASAAGTLATFEARWIST